MTDKKRKELSDYASKLFMNYYDYMAKHKGPKNSGKFHADCHLKLLGVVQKIINKVGGLSNDR